jgi:hypothetical protein
MEVPGVSAVVEVLPSDVDALRRDEGELEVVEEREGAAVVDREGRHDDVRVALAGEAVVEGRERERAAREVAAPHLDLADPVVGEVEVLDRAVEAHAGRAARRVLDRELERRHVRAGVAEEEAVAVRAVDEAACERRVAARLHEDAVVAGAADGRVLQGGRAAVDVEAVARVALARDVVERQVRVELRLDAVVARELEGRVLDDGRERGLGAAAVEEEARPPGAVEARAAREVDGLLDGAQRLDGAARVREAGGTDVDRDVVGHEHARAGRDGPGRAAVDVEAREEHVGVARAVLGEERDERAVRRDVRGVVLDLEHGRVADRDVRHVRGDQVAHGAPGHVRERHAVEVRPVAVRAGLHRHAGRAVDAHVP